MCPCQWFIASVRCLGWNFHCIHSLSLHSLTATEASFFARSQLTTGQWQMTCHLSLTWRSSTYNEKLIECPRLKQDPNCLACASSFLPSLSLSLAIQYCVMDVHCHLQVRETLLFFAKLPYLAVCKLKPATLFSPLRHTHIHTLAVREAVWVKTVRTVATYSEATKGQSVQVSVSS